MTNCVDLEAKASWSFRSSQRSPVAKVEQRYLLEECFDLGVVKRTHSKERHSSRKEVIKAMRERGKGGCHDGLDLLREVGGVDSVLSYDFHLG